MQLLISPTSILEIDKIIFSHPDILDVKNPSEGSLGANFPEILQYARDSINNYEHQKEINEYPNNDFKKIEKIKLSIAIGDFPYKPGTAALAALGALQFNPDYIKMGLYGPMSIEEANYLCEKFVNTIHTNNFQKGTLCKPVIAAYADYYKLEKSISPMELPGIAKNTNADIIMIDTAIKDHSSLFSHISIEELQNFMIKAKSYNLKTALAGSINFNDLEKIMILKPDILGVRSIVCNNFDRREGNINPDLIRSLRTKLL